MRASPLRLLPLALLLAAAPLAAMVPPPIPEKDLSFGDGWTFQSRGNNCTATRTLGEDLTLRLGFTNFEDGYVWLSGKALPAIGDDEGAKHEKGAGSVEDADGNFADALDAGVTYASFPGTALFVDGHVAARFVYGETADGKTSYKLGHLQSAVWSRLKAGTEMRVKLLGKEAAVVQLSAATGLWEEMQDCIGQYPHG
ncbi:hypothetical protein [Sphingopyxis sp.]|uniref:hypothetical protein n=1 Tax=Sphingopyxis sp. TaxID=1908224 RepID=UPI003BAB82E9